MGKKRTATAPAVIKSRRQDIFPDPLFKLKRSLVKRLNICSLTKICRLAGTPLYHLIIGLFSILILLPRFLSPFRYRIKQILPDLPTRLPLTHWLNLAISPLAVPIRFCLSLKKILLITVLFAFFWVSAFLIRFIFFDLPDPNHLVNRDQILSTKIYDRHGTLLYKIYRNQNRTLVNLKDVPLPLIQATIAIEDADFYRHHGLSLRGIFRAAMANLREGKTEEGGSTITQQLVKNTLLTPAKTFQRKIREGVLALAVERIFSKEEILQMYLNEVGYGGATYGIEEAAQVYFGKSVSQLSLAESALLAGLPASPTRYSPFGTHPEAAKERQQIVLQRMANEQFITPEQSRSAAEETLNFAPQATAIKAPHFVLYVKDLLVEKYGERLVEQGGLEVTTSLDLNIQTQAESVLKEEINKLSRLKISNGAALVTNPKTGEILAMVGSKDYFDQSIDGNVNVTLRPRQPGSTIKVVNYALALQNGFSPTTILSDTPITYSIPGQAPYSPKNYDSRFHGNVPLRIALASSYNVPAVKVLSSLGVNRMIEMGRQMGITTWEDSSRFGLSLTLGGGEVKMTDLATVYGVLANQGRRADLTPILEIKDHTGKIQPNPFTQTASPQQILPPVTAFLLTNILSDNRARTPAFGPRSLLNIDRHPHVAVKTGTTQNLRDNWTIGYTPDLLTAVWVGNNDNTPMSQVASGITGASPIWNKIMTHLLKDQPDQEFPPPANLVKVAVCPFTNTLPCAGCPVQEEWFEAGHEPTTHCDPEKIKEIQKQKEVT